MHDCGLVEEIKWAVPCYTFQQNNILIVAAFKEYCALSFFKGSLLQDAEDILCKPGEETQSVRLIRFTNVREILRMEPVLKAYIYEAIEVEKAGLKANNTKNDTLPVPEEFQQKLLTDPILKQAFSKLTPGRQRGYLLYFSSPRQAKTRESRIAKSLRKILEGKGYMNSASRCWRESTVK